MKRILAIFLLLFFVVAAFAEANLYVNLVDAGLGLETASNRTVLVTGNSLPRGVSSGIVIQDKLRRTTDVNGGFWISNAVVGIYLFEVLSPPARSEFRVLLTNTTGTVYARSNMVASPNNSYPPDSVSWGAAAADARFASRADVVTLQAQILMPLTNSETRSVYLAGGDLDGNTLQIGGVGRINVGSNITTIVDGGGLGGNSIKVNVDPSAGDSGKITFAGIQPNPNLVEVYLENQDGAGNRLGSLTEGVNWYGESFIGSGSILRIIDTSSSEPHSSLLNFDFPNQRTHVTNSVMVADAGASFAGNGSGVSNAVDIIAGPGVTVVTNAGKRGFIISASNAGALTNGQSTSVTFSNVVTFRGSSSADKFDWTVISNASINLPAHDSAFVSGTVPGIYFYNTNGVVMGSMITWNDHIGNDKPQTLINSPWSVSLRPGDNTLGTSAPDEPDIQMGVNSSSSSGSSGFGGWSHLAYQGYGANCGLGQSNGLGFSATLAFDSVATGAIYTYPGIKGFSGSLNAPYNGYGLGELWFYTIRPLITSTGNNFTNSAGIIVFKMKTNSIAVSETNMISNAGSKLNGIGFTNNILTVPSSSTFSGNVTVNANIDAGNGAIYLNGSGAEVYNAGRYAFSSTGGDTGSPGSGLMSPAVGTVSVCDGTTATTLRDLTARSISATNYYGGITQTTNPPYALFVEQLAQSAAVRKIASLAFTNIIFTTNATYNFDNLSAFTLSNSFLIVNSAGAGRWRVHGSAVLRDSSGGGGGINIRLYRHNNSAATLLTGDTGYTQGFSTLTPEVRGTVTLASGDIIGLQAFTSFTGDVGYSISYDTSGFTVARLEFERQ